MYHLLKFTAMKLIEFLAMLGIARLNFTGKSDAGRYIGSHNGVLYMTTPDFNPKKPAFVHSFEEEDGTVFRISNKEVKVLLTLEA
jgi:hypothetical protein